MSVKLILLEDMEQLGNAGDEINVAQGYARNYLIPKGLAKKLTPGTLRQIAARKEKIEEKRKQDFESAQALAAKIAETDLTIQMQAGEDEQLFGSVTSHIIAETFTEAGLEIERQKIHLEEPIKELGMFHVEIKLHKDVTASAKIWVVRA
ncbi:MAG: 50S ribosomal protein L9 [Kiritimatiellaeota bacterium]|nr:50S ribosomal protein L9 [Kiritimatiellota bacterium]